MPMRNAPLTFMTTVAVMLSGQAGAQDHTGMEQMPSTADMPMHKESAQTDDQQAERTPPGLDVPPLPAGITLDEVFGAADSEPPPHFGDPVMDEQIFGFVLFDQFEYRVTDDDAPDHLGWEADFWVGGDLNKFWWKSEGEAIFDGPNEGESENDFLYSRLVTPFWSLQTGVQYASEWTPDDYEDRWSYVLALQGVAPYQVELDGSALVSEEGDVTLEIEGEYDLRITQRLLLQPRLALGLAAQDIDERNLGAGITSGDLDLRLRYEITREFAPYIGARYHFLVGETEDLASAAGEKTEQWMVLAGVRFAF
ncbi:copper resistance protein B [Marinobacter salicampi]|uniref:copper resistance protein B n=1 Tax=Marinobacter salicampi TaxID=435907 RepID=UPI00140D7765|nr:copper resistance protein B [Marinobacter salicampi]